MTTTWSNCNFFWWWSITFQWGFFFQWRCCRCTTRWGMRCNRWRWWWWWPRDERGSRAGGSIIDIIVIFLHLLCLAMSMSSHIAGWANMVLSSSICTNRTQVSATIQTDAWLAHKSSSLQRTKKKISDLAWPLQRVLTMEKPPAHLPQPVANSKSQAKKRARIQRAVGLS